MSKEVISLTERLDLGLYSLPTGIPPIVVGEKLVRSEESQMLSRFEGGSRFEMFEAIPVRSIRMVQGENVSWVYDLEGFDESGMEKILEVGDVSVSFLELHKGLSEITKVDQVVQIGVREGENEVTFNRILLPKELTDNVSWLDLEFEAKGRSISEVSLEVWESLGVEDYDAEWDKRVKDYLTGNVRDMDRGEIEYWMKDGVKMVEWMGVEMPAILLSDKNDINRAGTEQEMLASMQPGEAVVSYYSHGDSGGAVSAGTAGEEIPENEEENGKEVIGDVQLVGENGKIYQMSIEGTKEEIEAKVAELLDVMRASHGLVDPSTVSEVMPVHIQPEYVTMMLMPMMPMTSTIDLEERVGIDYGEAEESVVTSDAPEALEVTWGGALHSQGEIYQENQSLNDIHHSEIGSEWETFSEAVGGVDQIDEDFDEPEPEEPESGPSGGLVIRPVKVNQDISEVSLASNQVVGEEYLPVTTGRVMVSNSSYSSQKFEGGFSGDPMGGGDPSGALHSQGKTGQENQSLNDIHHSEIGSEQETLTAEVQLSEDSVETVVSPILDIMPDFKIGEENIPEWRWEVLMEELSWSMAIPSLDLFTNLSNKINSIDSVWADSLVFFVISNTFREQIRVRVPVAVDTVSMGQMSGLHNMVRPLPIP